VKEQFTECIDVAVDDTHYYAIIQEMHNIWTGRELFEYRKIENYVVSSFSSFCYLSLC